ncbi:unnamed protein product [Onchocerca ochengi]|uniref:Secreted protein n=1 Tax=Onchocerca ochengi TaxID=42157 RepID=A0A182ED26_ONCOC|nr:unnamed protein product [Onchocerca ochengi]
MQDMKAWLTILITIYFYSSSNGEDVTNCSSTGIWSSWSSWQNVMPNNSDGLYLQLRKRLCQENPQNCTTKTKDYCK